MIRLSLILASLLSQDGSISQISPPHRLAVPLWQPTPLFLPPVLSQPPHGRNPHALPVQVGRPPCVVLYPPPKKNGSYLVMRRHAPKQQALLPSSKFRPPLAPLTTSTISRLCPSASQPSAKHTLSTETSWKCRSVNSITAFLLHSFSTIFL